ncbi:hypothetical protein [Streptomyces roseolilacinus]|uniref:Uncharacterized protein n=1 Tax=Streptomyces roseolilacinus TaxID=66904 RepID=A0A918AZJ8_9ACTN|nr:hypothetical protein [Streptomyces roseolilacinus]GGP96177.1 hypothetical protein GCM10010249_12900 [Streptomyces roseolilacinus]
MERGSGDARNLQDFAHGPITYAALSGGQGCLRLSGFGGHVGEDTPHAGQDLRRRGHPAAFH